MALRLGDVEPVPGRGLRLLVRRSKTDQHGRGEEVAIWANPGEPLFCPMIALDAWLGHRHQARDLDRSAAETARRERPLFCAVTKSGRASGYTTRARAEAAIGRFKQVIGDGLRSRTDKGRATEVDVAVRALNRMLELGRPNYIRAACPKRGWGYHAYSPDLCNTLA